MAWKADSRASRRSRDATRLPWLLTMVVPLASIVILWAAVPALADIGVPVPGSLLSHEVEEEFEEEEGEEICEDLEGYEVCEEAPIEDGQPVAPDQCLLRSADARVFVSRSAARLRLVIDYTSAAAGSVSVDFFLKGAKGPLSLGTARRHLGRRGKILVNERLKARQIEKARAARSFVVRLDIPRTPGYCRRYNTKRLTVLRYVHGTPVWFQAGATVAGR